MSRLAEALLLRSAASGLATLLELSARLDRRCARAIRALRATYELRYGRAARRLLFDGGRVRTSGARAGEPDYSVTFVDLPGALSQLARSPGDVLRLQLENKVQPAGNVYYLFQLGYLLGLAARQLEEKAKWLRASTP